ncbi:MAG TPA: hypothetical protein VHR40_09880 [Thermoleophilaceae bacterium]|jgi:hypothetical protein|nr:hypothetical protein [Thermoleophilaceae bacterium]
MNGAPLTYAVVALHQHELRLAAERDRRALRKPRRGPRLPSLPWRRRPRRAFA